MSARSKIIEGTTKFIEIGQSNSKVRHIWIICTKCKKGRWVIMQRVFSPGFTGICSDCYEAIIKRAMKPYVNIDRIIAIRRKVVESVPRYAYLRR